MARKTYLERATEMQQASTQRRLADAQIQNMNDQRSLEMAKLAPQGITMNETEGPRRLFGLIPGETQRSFQYNPPPMPEGYVNIGGKIEEDKTYFNPEKLREQERIKAEELQRAFSMSKEMSGGNQPGSADDTKSPLVFDPFRKAMIPNPAYVKAPDAQKLQDDEEKKQKADEDLKESAQSNLDTIGEVKKGLKYFGPMGELPSIASPSSLAGEYGPRVNWEANFQKLLSGRVIEIMTAMKQASKTGATGFGQLSEKELQVLQQASTALKRNLMPQDAEKYLTEIERIHRKVLSGNGGGNSPKNQENGSGNDITEEDIQYTMQKNGLSRDEVLKRIGHA